MDSGAPLGDNGGVKSGASGPAAPTSESASQSGGLPGAPAARPGDDAMNLLCPNCHQRLEIPDHYTGQMMKCPLCSGTFTAPALPAGSAPAGEPVAAAPAPPATPPAGPPPAQDVYGVRAEPEARPPEPAPAVPERAMPARAEPDRAAVTPAPAEREPYPAAAPSEGGYTRSASVRFNPQVLQWVPPAALFLIFIFQWFPWVGVYPGGVAMVTQTAWGAGFGGYSENPGLGSYYFPDNVTEGKTHAVLFKMTTDKDKDVPDNRPRVSVLTLFYLLLFIPTLVVTIAAVVLPYTQVKLPPQVEQLMPWRWAIVTGLTAVLLLFLVLQLLLNFSLEARMKAWYDAQPGQQHKEDMAVQTRLRADADRGVFVDSLERKWPLRWSVVLHLLAVLAAALVFWHAQRGEGAPVAKLELRW
jgi:hypothetical protein